MAEETLTKISSVNSGIATAELNPERTQLADSIPIDNSSLLVARYDKWVGALQALNVFVDDYLSFVQSGVKHHEKMNKSLLNTMIPQFDVDHATGSSATPNVAAKPTASSTTLAEQRNVDGMNQWFDSLKYNVDLNWKKYQEVEQSIKINIVPEFKKAIEEIHTKKKNMMTEQAKEVKELRKLLANTNKELTKLGNATQVYTNSASVAYKVDYKNDPYFCNRTLLHQGDLQLQKENLYIDFLTNNEQSFEIFEKQLVDTIKKIFNNLNNLNADLTKQQANSFELLKDQLLSVPNEAEWAKFADLNRKQLISGNPYKRSLKGVTFPNDGHVSIEPILEGLLARKEGKLKKNYSTYFYVITKTRYIYEFQSRSFKDSPHPSLVFYLPHTFIGKPSTPQDDKFKFQLIGKDHSNLLNLTKKNITLRASNYEEMLTWYNVLAEVSGQMNENEESRLEAMNLDESFESPNPQADTSVDSRV